MKKLIITIFTVVFALPGCAVIHLINAPIELVGSAIDSVNDDTPNDPAAERRKELREDAEYNQRAANFAYGQAQNYKSCLDVKTNKRVEIKAGNEAFNIIKQSYVDFYKDKWFPQFYFYNKTNYPLPDKFKRGLDKCSTSRGFYN